MKFAFVVPFAREREFVELMGVGLGAVNASWRAFLPDEGRATLAAQLDEGLAVWAGLLAGQPFAYAGAHWGVDPVTELAPPPPCSSRIRRCGASAHCARAGSASPHSSARRGGRESCPRSSPGRTATAGSRTQVWATS
jgi:hypothetical protein